MVDNKDDFESISKRLNVTVEQIKVWNNLGEQAELQLGQSLIIWRAAQNASYTVKNGDSLTRIALAYHTNVQKLLYLNPNLRRTQLRAGQVIRVY